MITSLPGPAGPTAPPPDAAATGKPGAGNGAQGAFHAIFATPKPAPERPVEDPPAPSPEAQQKGDGDPVQPTDAAPSGAFPEAEPEAGTEAQPAPETAIAPNTEKLRHEATAARLPGAPANDGLPLPRKDASRGAADKPYPPLRDHALMAVPSPTGPGDTNGPAGGDARPPTPPAIASSPGGGGAFTTFPGKQEPQAIPQDPVSPVRSIAPRPDRAETNAPAPAPAVADRSSSAVAVAARQIMPANGPVRVQAAIPENTARPSEPPQTAPQPRHDTLPPPAPAAKRPSATEPASSRGTRDVSGASPSSGAKGPDAPDRADAALSRGRSGPAPAEPSIPPVSPRAGSAVPPVRPAAVAAPELTALPPGRGQGTAANAIADAPTVPHARPESGKRPAAAPAASGPSSPVGKPAKLHRMSTARPDIAMRPGHLTDASGKTFIRTPPAPAGPAPTAKVRDPGSPIITNSTIPSPATVKEPEITERGKAETPLPAPRDALAQPQLSHPERQPRAALPPAGTANPPPLRALAEAQARNRTGIAPTHRDGAQAPRSTAPSKGPDAEAPRPAAPSTQAPPQVFAVPVPPPPAQSAPAQAARAFAPTEPYDRGDPELRAQSPGDAPRSGGETLTTSRPAPLPTSDGAATARQIAAQIATGAARGADRPVEVVLNPAELGRVRLSMTASDGMMIVSITADRAETLDLMRRHSDTLAQEFQDIGYEGTKFEFGKGGGDGKRPDTSDQGTGTSFTEDEIEGPAPPGTGIVTSENSTDRVDIRL